MGQKVSPHGLRVGVIQDWDSKWYADKKNFADFIAEDDKVRKFVKKEIYGAGVSKIVIERPGAESLTVRVLVKNPGVVIGSNGENVEKLKKSIEKLTKKKVVLDIIEVKKFDADAQLTAESIADALEKRIAFRRAMKSAIQRAMKAGAKGIKVVISGRVGGAEIARSEKYAEGNVPLHTLRANIDYGFAEADTQYGKIGVKVWVNNGEVLDKTLIPTVPADKPEKENKKEGRQDRRNGDRRRKDGDRAQRSDRRDSRKGGKREDRPAKAVNPRMKPKKEVPAAAVEAVPETPATAEE